MARRPSAVGLRGGGDRREATTGSDRGARRAAVRAGRGGDGLPGPRWPRTQMAAPRAIPALHPASIVLRVQAPGGRPGQQGVHQGPQDRGRVHDLSFHRRRHGLVHEPANWEDHYRARERAGEGHHTFRRLYYRGAYGAERALHSRASRREAVRAPHRERNRGQAGVLGHGAPPGHHLAVPARPCPRERVRRADLEPRGTEHRGRSVRSLTPPHITGPKSQGPAAPGPATVDARPSQDIAGTALYLPGNAGGAASVLPPPVMTSPPGPAANRSASATGTSGDASNIKRESDHENATNERQDANLRRRDGRRTRRRRNTGHGRPRLGRQRNTGPAHRSRVDLHPAAPGPGTAALRATRRRSAAAAGDARLRQPSTLV